MFPFQLFLFSFAVLGPLHYFTEIPWLHGKGYYTTGKYDFIMLAALCCGVAALYFINSSQGNQNRDVATVITVLSFVAFFGALTMITMKKTWQKVLALILIGASSLLFSHLDTATMIFANFVPSIIHVYVFTGCFILYGALRHKSPTGIFSLIVFALCTVLIFAVTPGATSDRSLSYYIKTSYVNFASLNFDLMNILGLEKVDKSSTQLQEILFTSNAGIIVMRLIAFSYTYHFLNWFSKTSIIKWHLIPKKSLAIILLLWVGSLALYALNFTIGIQYLYFLSLLHVMLEFPLNHRTFLGIGTELKKLIFTSKAAS
jgi:hypothetical protein